MISPSALRGYVLEELLAGELRHTGFLLLVDSSQDPLALAQASNGLRVRGRGADHQVDVLGELEWEIPFSLPVRLFVEAKYRDAPVGISDVRNAVGVINDVNEHYSAAAARGAAPGYFRRFHYRYSLFSASGFTADAEQFAFTQQISLVDLSAPARRRILRTAFETAEVLREMAFNSGLRKFPVNQMREAFRRALGTWPLSDDSGTGSRYSEGFEAAYSRASASSMQDGDLLPLSGLAQVAADLVEAVDGSLYFAVTNTPFLIVVHREGVQSDDSSESVVSAQAEFEGPRLPRPARLTSTSRTSADAEWALVTSDQEIVRFSTTPSVERAVLSYEAGDRSRHAGTRTITIMDGAGGTPLLFEPLDEVTRESRQASAFDPGYLYRDDIDYVDLPIDIWTHEAMELLLKRLRDERRPQAEVIVEAARRGGRISRDLVYQIAGFSPDRTLRGFTKPPRRIAAQLIARGQLDPDAPPPLVAVYRKGVLATHFQVPREFAEFYLD
ncbi:hypothetical protein GCM10010464_00360 [Pseudonocardia yunnanensis]|uniref:Restriction endonuclease n=1 Tax=Pseudonocardia yunnanensis TaxID=58107 RepID=A0ABW4FE74_9PSEU